MTAAHSIKTKLIRQAVRKLKRFGFANVTDENIGIDDVYKLYFNKILLLNLGKNKETDKVIHQLLEKTKGLTDGRRELKYRFQK